MQLLAVFLVTISIATISEASLVGGLSSDEKKPLEKDDPVEAMILKLSSEIKKEVEAKLVTGSGTPPVDVKNAHITVLAYKTQVVAGKNYFVKASIDKVIFHLKIYNDLQDHSSLTAVEGPKKESDPITYF